MLLILPSTNGLYYAPASTPLAALVSSLPADRTTTAACSWNEASKRINHGTLTTFDNMLKGDVIRITAGTNVVVGDYVLAADAVNGSGAAFLTTSIQAPNLVAGADIVATTQNSAAEARAGFLKNPARNGLVYSKDRAKKIGIFCVMPISGFGAAGDTVAFGDADGGALSVPGSPIALGNAARVYAFGHPACGAGGEALTPNPTANSPLTFTTAGTGTGWALYYNSD